MLAGELMLGEESMETTETKIDSIPMIGRQRSVALSNSLCLSSPGAWRMEMHTLPSGQTAKGGGEKEEEEQIIPRTKKCKMRRWGKKKMTKTKKKDIYLKFEGAKRKMKTKK